MYRGDRNSRLLCYVPQIKGALSVVVLGFLVAIVVPVSSFSIDRSPKAEPTLRFLSILHRHGERVPESTPLDPFQNASYWSEGKGELMQKGKVSLFELGKFLRNRYDGFLPAIYKSTDLYVRSTFMDRTIMSAQALLSGLYPPVGKQIWNQELLWQPIPVHHVPKAMDDLLYSAKPCALKSKELNYVETTLVQKKLDEERQLLNYLSNKTGLEIKTIMDVYYVYDNLLIADEQGLKLPEWTQEIYPDKLKSLALFSFTVSSGTPTLKKLHSGMLINEILHNMKTKRNDTKFKRLLNLYSAHDVTIISLWRSLGIVQELSLPNYGATMIIELHQIGDKYRVKILYKSHALDKDLTVLSIRGCEGDQNQDGMCDLDTFASALEPVAISDYDKECQIGEIKKEME